MNKQFLPLSRYKLLIFPTAISAVLFASATAPAQQTAGPTLDNSAASALVAVPVNAGRGLEKSTAEIMADPRANGPRNPIILNWEHPQPDRRHLPAAPGGLQEAQWPRRAASAAQQDSQRAPSLPQTVPLTFNTVTGPTDTGAFPPDTMGAVGPTQFFAFVNGRLRTFNKTTGAADGIIDADADGFFASVITPPSASEISFTSDPNVRYDRLSNRWFLTIIDVVLDSTTFDSSRPNRVLIAVSSTMNITGSTVWKFYQFQGDATLFTDYVSLGIDANALYIGGNMFTLAGSFVSTKGFVIPKAPLLAGSPATVWSFPSLATSSSPGPFAPRGVDNYDSSNTGVTAVGYFIGVDVVNFGTLAVRRITNPGSLSPAPTISANILVTTPLTTNYPVLVPHLGNTQGTGGRLDPIDDRLYAAHLRNNRLWTAHNIGVNNTGVASATDTLNNRCAVRWYELQNIATTPTVRQSGTLFDNNATNDANQRNYWIPSIMVSGQGHAALGCTIAGTNERVNAFATGRLANDTLGTLQNGPGGAALPGYTSSSTAYNPPGDTGGGSSRRWGDYSFTSLDPSDDMTMWTIQEFCNGTNTYGCQVAKLLAPPPAVPATANPASTAAGQPSINVIVTGTSASGSGFYDPGTGFPNRIAAAVTGGVVVNSVTYTDPTHVTLNLDTSTASPGSKDIKITNPDGQFTTGTGILTLTPSGTTHFAVTAPANATSGTPFNVSVTALDSTSSTVTSYTGTVHFTKTDAAVGSAVPSDYTFVPGDNGTHTFGVTLITPGNQTVTATDVITSSITGTSNAINIPKATPTIATTASANTTSGGSISDTATVSGGMSPTGTVTFALFGPNDATCGSAAVFTSTKTIDANRVAVSASFNPTAIGTYRWVATYNGDTSNDAVAGACNDPNESVVISVSSPAITTAASAPVALGDNISDAATLSGSVTATGTIVFKIYGPDDATCGGAAAFTSAPVTVNGNGLYNSGPFTPSQAGTYRWIASYSGDVNSNPTSGACNDPNESVIVNPAASTVALASSANPSDFGQNITFTATVVSTAGTPTGTVQFKDAGTNIDGPVTLDGSGKASISTSSLTSATHAITAEYSGDANHAAATGNLSQVVNNLPTLSVADASVTEGNSGAAPANLSVTLSAASALEVKVDVAAADGTATAPSDYEATTGTLTFAPGETQKTVAVSVKGDTDFEPDETFTVHLTNPQNATLLRAAATGTITNDEAQPTPTPTATPPTLANISTRLRVNTGDNVLIGGFIVTGTQAKKLIIRAIGPSLPVTDALADPVVELYSTGHLIASNDNWVDSADKQAIIDSTIPPSNDFESALIVNALPGAYTAIVRGVNGGTGVGLIEVFDLDRTVDSKLANISTRGLVQTGDNVLIGGLIVLGQDPLKVIIRAIGPSLPVDGKLLDPTLELHEGNGTLLQANDNWRSDQEAEIIATTVPPSNDAESAIVRTLSPGNYTAIVRGVNGTAGVGLVEVYGLQ